MQRRDGNFQGAAGHSVYYQIWTPEKPPRGVLLVVHGAGEHSARYAALAGYSVSYTHLTLPTSPKV